MVFSPKLVPVALLLLACCGRTTLKESVVAKHGGSDEFAEMDFWDALAKQRMVCNSDALHALVLSFEAQPSKDAIATADSRGWISATEQLAPLESARVGWIAKAVCIETGIKGGVTMRVFGPRERYSVNELNYRGWLPNMTPQQTISGMQLMALLGRAEDFRAGGTGTVMKGAN